MKLNKSPFVIIWVTGSLLSLAELLFDCNSSVVKIRSVVLIIIGLIGTVFTQSRK